MLKKMLGAARKASEGCDASFQLADLLQKCMQACWGSRSPGLSAKREHYGILAPQACAGMEQAFLARLSKLWGATHGKEAAATSVAQHRLSGGRAWLRKARAAAWGRAHLAWLGRSQDRHGREQKERAGRARRRNLREIAMWHRGKPRSLLGMPGGEEPFWL